MVKSALIALFAAASALCGATIQTEPVTVTTEYGDTLTIGGAPVAVGSTFDVTVSAAVSTDDTERSSVWLIRQPVTADGIEIGRLPWWLVLRVRPPVYADWRMDLHAQVGDTLLGRMDGVSVITEGPGIVRTGLLGATVQATGTYTVSVAPVSEPANIGLCGIALSLIGMYRRSRAGKGARHESKFHG